MWVIKTSDGTFMTEKKSTAYIHMRFLSQEGIMYSCEYSENFDLYQWEANDVWG